ncbi:hypothetical protein EDC04DRAFT_2606035 [Pisolithus marmoratus]|nr:hypothetical protein EDC04DRAFT_2606035 [Pisolithus marmoratus]
MKGLNLELEMKEVNETKNIGPEAADAPPLHYSYLRRTMGTATIPGLDIRVTILGISENSRGINYKRLQSAYCLKTFRTSSSLVEVFESRNSGLHVVLTANLVIQISMRRVPVQPSEPKIGAVRTIRTGETRGWPLTPCTVAHATAAFEPTSWITGRVRAKNMEKKILLWSLHTELWRTGNTFEPHRTVDRSEGTSGMDAQAAPSRTPVFPFSFPQTCIMGGIVRFRRSRSKHNGVGVMLARRPRSGIKHMGLGRSIKLWVTVRIHGPLIALLHNLPAATREALPPFTILHDRLNTFLFIRYVNRSARDDMLEEGEEFLEMDVVRLPTGQHSEVPTHCLVW